MESEKLDLMRIFNVTRVINNEQELDDAIQDGVQVYLINNDFSLTSNKNFPEEIVLAGIKKQYLRKESLFCKLKRFFKMGKYFSSNRYFPQIDCSVYSFRCNKILIQDINFKAKSNTKDTFALIGEGNIGDVIYYNTLSNSVITGLCFEYY